MPKISTSAANDVLNQWPVAIAQSKPEATSALREPQFIVSLAFGTSALFFGYIGGFSLGCPGIMGLVLVGHSCLRSVPSRLSKVERPLPTPG
jgi:hypothetical protein